MAKTWREEQKEKQERLEHTQIEVMTWIVLAQSKENTNNFEGALGIWQEALLWVSELQRIKEIEQVQLRKMVESAIERCAGRIEDNDN